VEDLPLEVREINDIAVDQSNRADAGRGQVQSSRRSQPSGSDKEHFGLAEFQLALAADILQDDVTAVPLDLSFSEFHASIHRLQGRMPGVSYSTTFNSIGSTTQPL
jgi:hypothetical protein